MANLYRLFRELVPEPPLLVGTVTTGGSEHCRVTLVDGAVLTVRGAGTNGQKVFCRNGVIEGLAPELTTEIIEI